MNASELPIRFHSIKFNPPFCGTYANSADPDQTPQNAVSDQGLHCLLTNVLFRYE